MEDEEVDIFEWETDLEAFATQVQELECQHRKLDTQVESHTNYARNEIAKDRHILSLQLQVACGSMKHTIEAVNPSQRWLSWHCLESIALAHLSQSCRDLTTHFDRLADLAANANKKLNAIYRDALETEDQLIGMTSTLKILGRDSERLLENVDEVLEEMQDMTQKLLESREEAVDQLDLRRNQGNWNQEQKRHH